MRKNQSCDCKSYGPNHRVHYINAKGNCAGCEGYITEEQKQSGTKIIKDDRMSEVKSIYNLKLHESLDVSENQRSEQVLCKRVVGGWVYTTQYYNPNNDQMSMSSVFVPEPASLYYTACEGETLSLFAEWFGTTVEKLLILNPAIKDPDLIYAGQVYKLR